MNINEIAYKSIKDAIETNRTSTFFFKKTCLLGDFPFDETCQTFYSSYRKIPR